MMISSMPACWEKPFSLSHELTLSASTSTMKSADSCPRPAPMFVHFSGESLFTPPTKLSYSLQASSISFSGVWEFNFRIYFLMALSLAAFSNSFLRANVFRSDSNATRTWISSAKTAAAASNISQTINFFNFHSSLILPGAPGKRYDLMKTRQTRPDWGRSPVKSRPRPRITPGTPTETRSHRSTEPTRIGFRNSYFKLAFAPAFLACLASSCRRSAIFREARQREMPRAYFSSAETFSRLR